MTTAEVFSMLQKSGLPVSYFSFDEEAGRPAPPYLCFYYGRGHDVYADGVNYATIDELHVLRYSAEPDLHEDRKIGCLLNEHNLTCEWDRLFDERERLWVTEWITEVKIDSASE